MGAIAVVQRVARNCQMSTSDKKLNGGLTTVTPVFRIRSFPQEGTLVFLT
jgi:hypothetical protein